VVVVDGIEVPKPCYHIHGATLDGLNGQMGMGGRDVGLCLVIQSCTPVSNCPYISDTSLDTRSYIL